jgi:ferrous iron transport protein A
VVETVRRSPAGDPVAFKIRGAAIALRLEEGRRVYIQQL